MNKNDGFDDQFNLEQDYYLKHLDFLNWYRYYFIIKAVIKFMPANVLEIGIGSGMVKNCLKSIVKTYRVLDINKNLAPDILGDVRNYYNELENTFDCAIAADVLEHIPFTDLLTAQKRLGYNYYSPQEKPLFIHDTYI